VADACDTNTRRRRQDAGEGKALAEPDIWYVSYRSNILPKHDGDERKPVRAARRFKSEAEAREFALEIIGSGWSAIAGTINPHKPKKTISSRAILAWIKE